MTVANSTRRKPAKPYPEFPLFAHNNGQWCRKIRGKLYGFGKWDEPTEALMKHNDEYSFLKEGIAPPERTARREDASQSPDLGACADAAFYRTDLWSP